VHGETSFSVSIAESLPCNRVTYLINTFPTQCDSQVRYRVYESLLSANCQILDFTSYISKFLLNIVLIIHFLPNKLRDEEERFILNVNSISSVDLSTKIGLSSRLLSKALTVTRYKAAILLFCKPSRVVGRTHIKRHVLK
jgi:hypothetical protein